MITILKCITFAGFITTLAILVVVLLETKGCL